MIKDIRYQGYTANPSDYDSPDGDLALSLNLINEDGSLKPILANNPKFKLPEHITLLCEHITPNIHHLIVHNNIENDINRYKIGYIDQNSSSSKFNIVYTDIYIYANITCAKTLGNVLAIFTNEGINKLLWTVKDGESMYQGFPTRLPEAKLSFGLNAYYKYHHSEQLDYDGELDGHYYNLPKLSSKGMKDFVDSITARANKMIAEITKSGRFTMPFFVRYAYRLFDGSLTNQSSPILMVPNSFGAPLCFLDYSVHTGAIGDRISWEMFAPSCMLDMQLLLSSEEINRIKSYSDIIKSIDIFVSAPIYSYNPDGEECTFSHKDDAEESSAFGSFSINSKDATELYEFQNEHYYPGIINAYNEFIKYANHNVSDAFTCCKGHRSPFFITLPRKNKENIIETVKNTSNFYFVKSIPINELGSWTNRSDIILGKTLSSLTTRETLPDDFVSHNTIFANNSYVYNSRMALSGIRSQMNRDYSIFPFCETNLTDYGFLPGQRASELYNQMFENCFLEVGSVRTDQNSFNIEKIFTYIDKGGKRYIIKEESGTKIASLFPSLKGSSNIYTPYWYDADSDTFKVEMYGTSSTNPGRTFMLSMKMSPHDMLNGSVYFFGISTQPLLPASSIPTETDNNIVSLPNRLYVSEVNNPFIYPAQSVVSVGSGSIIGVASAAQALSQGQFGSFPLYAFTTDGVWALSVSSTGSFSAVQPITRDVCINSDSITQLDGSVLFASDRGIMSIAGSTVRCISDAIFTEHPFNVLSLQHMDDLHKMLHPNADSCLPIKPMLSFLKNCRMLYDYINQRVYIFNPSTDTAGSPEFSYSYVLSLKSGAWGMAQSDLAYTIDSYPHAMAVSHSGDVICFDGNSESNASCLFVTRPIKLGNGDVFKSIHSVIQRGNFNAARIIKGVMQHGDVNTVLYGSRDMQSWFLIGSSKNNRFSNLRGTPYKYFRIAGVANLADGQSLSGATIDVMPRETTKLH